MTPSTFPTPFPTCSASKGKLWRPSPEVDAERVAEVRARIDSGEYEVDAQRVASKLARLEQDLS